MRATWVTCSTARSGSTSSRTASCPPAGSPWPRRRSPASPSAAGPASRTTIRPSRAGARGQRHAAPAQPARVRHRPGHRRRPADQRSRHLPPARRDPGQRAPGQRCRSEIVDLGSTNGIIVNGHKVQRAAPGRGHADRDRLHPDAGARARRALRRAMSELAVTVIKVLYLALLWLFILSAVSVIRSDLFGRTVPTPDQPGRPQPLEEPPPRRRRPEAARGASRTADHRPGPAGRAVGQPGRRRDHDRPRLRLPADPGRRLRLDPARPGGRGRAGLYVEDLGSTNGTYVNGQRITAPTSDLPARHRPDRQDRPEAGALSR